MRFQSWNRCALVGALLLASCAVERTLRISSEPPGADVRLDGELVGQTPLVVPFDAYGTRRVTLYLAGHRVQSRRVRVKPPWYLRFPVDFVTEVLLPFGWKDNRRIAFELERESGTVSEADLSDVLQRAEALRRAGPEGPRPRFEETQTIERIESGAGNDAEPPASTEPRR